MWNRNSRVRSFCGSGLPSTVILSVAVTFSAGDVILLPLTDTRPASIQASASRREARPARAITLAMRSAALAGGSGTSTAGFGSVVLSRLPRKGRPRWWPAGLCCLDRVIRSFVMPGFMPGIHVFIHGWAR